MQPKINVLLQLSSGNAGQLDAGQTERLLRQIRLARLTRSPLELALGQFPISVSVFFFAKGRFCFCIHMRPAMLAARTCSFRYWAARFPKLRTQRQERLRFPHQYPGQLRRGDDRKGGKSDGTAPLRRSADGRFPTATAAIMDQSQSGRAACVVRRRSAAGPFVCMMSKKVGRGTVRMRRRAGGTPRGESPPSPRVHGSDRMLGLSGAPDTASTTGKPDATRSALVARKVARTCRIAQDPC